MRKLRHKATKKLAHPNWEVVEMGFEPRPRVLTTLPWSCPLTWVSTRICTQDLPSHILSCDEAASIGGGLIVCAGLWGCASFHLILPSTLDNGIPSLCSDEIIEDQRGGISSNKAKIEPWGFKIQAVTTRAPETRWIAEH